MKNLYVYAITLVTPVVIGSLLSRPPMNAASAAPPPMDKKEENTNASISIALRLRRTIYEDAYIAVPVTDAILKKKEDGTFGLDTDAFVAEGIRISKDARVEWRIESSKTEPHPIQKPKPENRRSFDPATAEPAK